MNLLFVVPSYYDENFKEINRYYTGQAVIAGDLCRNFSDCIKTDIIITGKPVKSINLGYANILSTSLRNLFKNFSLKGLKSIKFHGSIKERFKSLFSFLIQKQTEIYLKNGDYDIVAIHDFNESNMKVLQLCQRIGIKTVVTLHMYIGFDPELRKGAYKHRAAREEFLIGKTNVPITVVSSGLKKRILQDYDYIDPNRITVIPNGTNFLRSDKDTLNTKPLPDKFEGKKIFLCIGTIGNRKNQIQLVRSLNLLDKCIRSKIKILFIGVDTLDGRLQKMIADKGLDDVAEYIGVLSHKSLKDYYKNAYAVISTSLNEAFGITFIEGFCYGLPAVYFYDIDSADDLYSTDAVEIISGKDDKSIAYAITKTIKKSWDREKIKRYSQKFDICNVAGLYENKYKYIVNSNQ